MGSKQKHFVELIIKIYFADEPVVDVDDGEHVPLPGSELVLDAVLVALALYLHGRQHQTTSNEVSRVADTLGGFETEKNRQTIHSFFQSF
jgi:hypothetical protein